MKTALIFLTIAVGASVTFSAWRENEHRKLEAAARIAEEIKAASIAREAAEKQRLAARFQPVPSMHARELSYVPGLGRYIEHDSRVSAMQSIGGGFGLPAPKRTRDASEKTKAAWGFGKTALDSNQ